MKKITLSVLVVFISFGTIQSQDKNIKIGGRIMYDMAAWGEGHFSSRGTEFRRVRLFSSGSMYQNVKYKLQLDFAGGQVAFKDVFIELNKLPIKGNLRIGHFKEPLRLEVLTSSKYITFMERGLTSAMSRERNSGIMYHTIFAERISFQSGIFASADNSGNDKNIGRDINVTSRISYLAINTDERKLHIGISGSLRNSGNLTEYNITTRHENHLGTKISIYESNQKDVRLLAYELSYVNGPLSVQGEYVQSEIDNPDLVSNKNLDLISSYYGQVSYFLTGESRSYKSSLSGFGRVKPNNNYGENGWGALEIAARFSAIKVQESELLENITLGVNWYLNPNTRMMFNYVMGEMTNASGEMTSENAVMMRVQVDF
jgi:phosphate-selective porin OprO/OprP